MKQPNNTKAKIYSTALYMRLSRDDENFGDSVSIETQRTILQKFAAENGLRVYGEYVDDGWSGTNFDRPSFQRMMRDVEDGKVNCIVSKDLSRFGREHVMMDYYLEFVFPERQVRYIAIAENEDTEKGLSEFVPFKNLFNEMFSLRMEALVIQYSPRIYNKSVSPVLSVRPQSAVLLSRFCQSAGEAFHGQGFPDCGTGG